MKVTEFQLKNKLPVFLIESRKSPVVSVQMWVRTGSVDESKGEEGISHFIEHLVFKGTKKFGVGEIANLVESSGGELNAFTSFDQTVFYVTISSHYKNVALDVISQMMGFPRFDPSEVDSEREVVIEEIKRGKDSLSRVASQNLFSTAYPKSNYGKPVIGYESNVKNWPVKQIKKYFESRYSTQNMFLVVAGDFEKKQMKESIKKFFEPIELTKFQKSKKNLKEKPLKKTQVNIQESNFEQSIGYFAWSIPSVQHKEFPALQLASMMLGQGDSARLVQKLRLQNTLVNSIGSSVYYNNHSGLFIIQMAFSSEKLQPILPALAEELIRMKAAGFTAEELQRAKVNLLSDEAFGLENVENLANKLGYDQSICHDNKFTEKYLKKISQVKLADIDNALKKHFDLERMLFTLNANDKKSVLQKKIHEGLKYFKNPKKVKSKPTISKNFKLPTIRIGNKTDDIEVAQHALGFKYVIRKSNETPVIAARVAMLGGTRAEHENVAGAMELLSRSWLGGTESQNEFQLAASIEDIALRIGPNSGRNSLGLASESLKSYEKRAAHIFSEVLTGSLFPSEIIEREKVVQLEHIKVKSDQPAQVCVLNFLKSMFPGTYLGRDSLGTSESLKNVHREVIMNYFDQFLRPDNVVLSLAGPIDKDLWIETLAERLQGRVNPSKSLPVGKFQSSEKDVVFFEPSKKQQSHIIYGFEGFTMYDPDRYALQIIQSVLAGMGGRLFYELRERNSLAYSVSPIMLEGVEKGYFGAYIACSPDKVQKSVEMMKAEFRKLIENNISQEELSRAKQYLIGNFDIDLQRSSTISSLMLYDCLYGLDVKGSLSVSDKYDSVTVEQVRKVCQRLFSQNSFLSLVGPNNPFD